MSARSQRSRRGPMILCAGCQSSGSSLVSWCFLQRADTDGAFDAPGDVLPSLPTLATPFAWYKYTISCFRFDEVATYCEREGWDVRPLLVVRDPRAVFNSLRTKSYGANGTTAEQPPIWLRLRRFRQDWELFRRNGWPVIRHESLVTEGEPVLRRAVTGLGLPWDDGMLTWPKRREDFAAPRHGSPTLRASLGSSFADTVDPKHAAVKTHNIPPGDLRWLEEEFAELNADLGYPAHLPQQGTWTDPDEFAEPRYEYTRRYRDERRPVRAALKAIPDWVQSVLGGSSAKAA